jgi:TonB-linked SusC/RagA family outer membrane protein
MKPNYKISLNFVLSILFWCLALPLFGQAPDNDTTALKQEMVNIPFGSQPAWMVTGAVSTISNKELGKTFNLDLGNSLYGKLPGLTVMQEGNEPGNQSPLMRIRGESTFFQDRNILVIVDGYEMSLGHLVPEEIESITLLKDASATAIYGSRAANGVLLVTTKRGEEGDLRINFGMQHGLSTPTHLPKFLGSYDHALLFNEAFLNDNPGVVQVPYGSDALEAYRTGSDPFFFPDVDWYDEVLRSAAPISRYNLDFRGGTENVKYFVLLNHARNQGLYERTADLSEFSTNSNYQAFNFRINVDIDLSRRLKTSFIIGGNVVDKSNPAGNYTGNIFSQLSMVPSNAFPVKNPDGSYGGSVTHPNPKGDILETGMYNINGRVFQGTYRMTQQLDMITEGLNVAGEISFNNSFSSLSNKLREYRRYSISRDMLGDIIYTSIGQSTTLSGSEGQADQWRSSALRAFLNYSRTFDLTSFDGMLMYNQSSFTIEEGGLPYLDQGVHGRLTFAHDRRYIAEFAFSYNGMDVYPPENKYGFFPAGSLGWVLSNESFLNTNTTINFLKLRGSYGLTGRANRFTGNERFLFYQNWAYLGGYNLGAENQGRNSMGEAPIVNLNMTWEKQKQLNIGLEATFFERLDITLDYFTQERYDILTSPSGNIPAFIGMQFRNFNLGIVENKGWEGSITYNSRARGDFKYFITLNSWFAQNKIIDMAEEVRSFDYLYRTGHPVGQRFTLESLGFFRDQNDIAQSPVQTYESVVLPGDIKYKDQNGDGIIDVNDIYPIGDTGLPNLSGSMIAGFNYRGFDLALSIQGVTQRDVMLAGPYYYAFQDNGKVSEMALGRWTSAENHEAATYPRLSSVNNNNNYRGSSFWLRDGSFVKLRYLELGYNLPSTILNRASLQGVRVFVNGTNLLSLDHMDFSDPESIYGYPPVRTFSMGVNVNL